MASHPVTDDIETAAAILDFPIGRFSDAQGILIMTALANISITPRGNGKKPVRAVLKFPFLAHR
jgi:hypothetical protein